MDISIRCTFPCSIISLYIELQVLSSKIAHLEQGRHGAISATAAHDGSGVQEVKRLAVAEQPVQSQYSEFSLAEDDARPRLDIFCRLLLMLQGQILQERTFLTHFASLALWIADLTSKAARTETGQSCLPYARQMQVSERGEAPLKWNYMTSPTLSQY